VTERYAETADGAIAEAERLRSQWAEAGDASGVALAERLEGLLVDARDAARRGELPPRDGGFPLTRFVGDHEWGPDGSELVDRVYALQRIWEGRT
jgi:hypothetical protein